MFKSSKITVLISGICALVLSMGVARYAYTPMIPYMQTQTGMSESLAGWLAGWNYLGYLTGLFIVWLINDLRVKDYIYRYGLFVALVSTLIMGIHDSPLIWYLSRFFAGIATATGFMLGTGLVMKWLMYNNDNEKSEELGIHFSGVGLGIIVGAIVVEFSGTQGLLNLSWKGQWFTLFAVGLLLFIPAMAWLPRPVEEQIRQSRVRDNRHEPSNRWLILLSMAYICAGFSNTVNVTFTSLITELQPLEGKGGLMWVFVGLAAAPAPFIWDRIARRLGYLNAIRIAFVINIIGNIWLTLSSTFTATVISALTFGFAFMGIVSLVLTIIANKYRYRATQVMARLTLGYCIAQILSPILSGIVAEKTGSFDLSLYVVSGIMVLGLVCLLIMKRE
ncbi:MAG: YbfB/YjiJ family MFS transporter [Arenicella sp.]